MNHPVHISDFLSPLMINASVYRSVLELVTLKIKSPHLSIRAAERRGMLDRSSSYHCDCLNILGSMFIRKIISLQDFLANIKANTMITDATYIKREGKTVYGTKKIFNHVNGSYELLQDVLFTTNRIKGLNFIADFKIINHNSRHRTKPEEVAELMKSGKVKKGRGLLLMVG